MNLLRYICILVFVAQFSVFAEIRRSPEVRYGSIQEY